MLALAGLMSCAGAASASALRWSPRHRAGFTSEIGFKSMVCTPDGRCDALDADGRLLRFEYDPGRPSAGTLSHGVTEAMNSPAPLAAMACAQGMCTAVDARGDETTFGFAGHAGAFHYVRVDPALSGATAAPTPPALACPSTTQCVIADGAGGVVSFSPQDPAAAQRTVLDSGAHPELVSVACPSTSQCTAISQTEEWTFDPADPATATSAAIEPTTGAATALACPTTTQCTSVDVAGDETTFDPQTSTVGSPVSLFPARADLSAVVCPTATLCTAAPGPGDLESFDPQTGAVGAPVPTPGVGDLACLTAVSCLAAQSGAVVPFVPGSTQSFADQGTYVDNGSALLAVACPGATRCVAVSPSDEILSDPFTGHSPQNSAIERVPESGALATTDVACPQVALCTVTRGGEALTFDPSRVLRYRPIVFDHDGSATFTAIRCPAASECVEVDSDGVAVSDDPVSGHVMRRVHVEPGRALTALACPTRTQCTTTDDDGTAITFDPLSGHRLLSVRIDTRVGLDAPGSLNGHELDGIACATTQSCVAVDGLGDEVSFDPRSRHGAVAHRVDTAGGLTAVACPSVGRCVLTGADGREFTGRAGHPQWTATRLADASELTDVTCRSTTECLVTDNAGDEYTGR